MEVQVQDSLFSDPLSLANHEGSLALRGPRQSEVTGQSQKSSKDSFWTTVYRVAGGWALVISVSSWPQFLVSTFFESLRTGTIFHSGKKNFPRLFIRETGAC